MSRMLDLIRASAISPHQMMSAAKGALHVPPVEMLQILIYIAEHNKIHGEQARLTLAGWDEASAKQLAADPDTPKDILNYWLSPKNIRLSVFELLLENRSVQMSKLAELGSTLKGELIDVMIASPRVRNSMQVLNDLSANHNLTGAQAARVQSLINGNDGGTVESRREEKPHLLADVLASPALPLTTTAESTEEHCIPSDPETEKVVVAFMTEHAAEIAADAGKPFQPIGGIFEEELRSEEAPANASEASPDVTVAVATASAAGSAATAAQPALAKKPSPHKVHVDPANEQRGSVLQKIAKLDIKGRIQLAMKGSKEERSILVRDGTKIVALAVLDSPKISDGEVEKFASQRNVLEAVLRGIPMKRRFIKNYAVVRNLVFNPRTPLDIGLGLMKNLLVADLRNLCGNKEVSDTIRKLALRNFKQKTEAGNKT
jgi:hypothetical protein